MKTHVFEKLKRFDYLASKYADFKSMISQYSGPLNPEYCLIDFKIHELKMDEIPCRPIWHYDGTNTPNIEPPVRYCLYLTGEAISQTKFFSVEPALYDGTEKEIHDYATGLEEARETRNLDFNVWNHYTSHNLHAATKSLTAGTRVLIRMKEDVANAFNR